ncbi:MAG: UDP-N-acetylmuramate dehydrogenase [Bacteroidetes bacterium]|nr:UDP-N-acetylmuramate dehydrogenase [Bacteroidota bacterium]
MVILRNIPLADRTTIRLGGPASHFCSCATVDDLRDALLYAQQHGLRVQLLGGGSNTVFSDVGFNGLVIGVDLKGITYREEEGAVLAEVAAGEDWDQFVAATVRKGYAGIECLSGIPGSVGATPIQNVGAYGQEVKDTIVSVTVLDRSTSDVRTFTLSECAFSYRTSRFKTTDAGRYIVTSVSFRLQPNGRPTIHYPEVRKKIEASVDLQALKDGTESLTAVRTIVLALRAGKSMVIDPNDPNTRSVGSFFLNPIVGDEALAAVRRTWETIGDGTPVPVFPFGAQTKIPAAWLIERSGFTKGYTRNGVGISARHTLALVNLGGTTAALMELAAEIQQGVFRTFGLHLEMEANIIR